MIIYRNAVSLNIKIPLPFFLSVGLLISTERKKTYSMFVKESSGLNSMFDALIGQKKNNQSDSNIQYY